MEGDWSREDLAAFRRLWQGDANAGSAAMAEVAVAPPTTHRPLPLLEVAAALGHHTGDAMPGLPEFQRRWQAWVAAGGLDHFRALPAWKMRTLPTAQIGRLRPPDGDSLPVAVTVRFEADMPIGTRFPAEAELVARAVVAFDGG